MPFDINKYLDKKKNFNYFKLLKYVLLTYKKRFIKIINKLFSLDIINHSFVQFIIKLFKCILKFLFWLLPIVISLFYYNEQYAHVPYWLVFLAYLYWSGLKLQCDANYKHWEDLSYFNDYKGAFYKKFINDYKSKDFIIVLFFAVFVPINFFTIPEYIFLFVLICISDIYWRRYLTLEIKLDMLNEKLLR